MHLRSRSFSIMVNPGEKTKSNFPKGESLKARHCLPHHCGASNPTKTDYIIIYYLLFDYCLGSHTIVQWFICASRRLMYMQPSKLQQNWLSSDCTIRHSVSSNPSSCTYASKSYFWWSIANDESSWRWKTSILAMKVSFHALWVPCSFLANC